MIRRLIAAVAAAATLITLALPARADEAKPRPSACEITVQLTENSLAIANKNLGMVIEANQKLSDENAALKKEKAKPEPAKGAAGNDAGGVVRIVPDIEPRPPR